MASTPPPAWGPPDAGSPPPDARRKKPRRIFLWIFLALQALFLTWIIVGITYAVYRISRRPRT